jgi:HCO3- transporter family
MPVVAWFGAMILALLPTIVTLMDQQIAAVIVNRKENQLKVILPRLRQQQFVVLMFSVALERVRLPSRSFDCHDLHCHSFDHWSSKRVDGRLSRDMFV